MTKMNIYPLLLVRRRPRMSAATDLRGLVAGNTCIGRTFLMRRVRFYSQLVHSLTVVLTITDMCGQKKVWVRCQCMVV